MKPLSIRGRLSLAYAISFGILLGVLSLSIYRTAADRIYARVDEQLIERANVVRPFFSVSQGQVNWLVDKQQIDQSSYQVAHAIFDRQGQFLDGSALANIYNFYLTNEGHRAIRARTRTWETHSSRATTLATHRLRSMNQPITGSDGETYVLTVGTLLDQPESDLRQLATILVTLVPLVLLMGVVAGRWWAADALSPVSRITATTQRISATNLAERLPIRGANDELDQLSATLNEMIQRLEQSFDQMSQFLSNVSHELRTPLAALRGSCEVALRTAKSEAECRAVLQSNIEELDRMARTVSDLLTLARAEAGQTVLNRRPEDVAELVRDAVESVRALGIDRGIGFGLQTEGPVTAPVDPEHVLRAMLNLLDNAIKYNRPGGRVDVAVEADADWVRISVKDTGVGISTKDREHIFDRYYRGGTEETAGIAGTGLGLGLARWVALAHGGQIEVESEVGQGSCFRLHFPRGTGLSSAASSPSATASLPRTTDHALSSAKKRRTPMERNIVKWTYWLGIACTAVAFVWRGAVSFGVEPRLELPIGGTVGYEGFINGAVLFLLLAAATSGYLSMEDKR